MPSFLFVSFFYYFSLSSFIFILIPFLPFFPICLFIVQEVGGVRLKEKVEAKKICDRCIAVSHSIFSPLDGFLPLLCSEHHVTTPMYTSICTRCISSSYRSAYMTKIWRQQFHPTSTFLHHKVKFGKYSCSIVKRWYNWNEWSSTLGEYTTRYQSLYQLD